MPRRLFGARSDEIIFRAGTGAFALLLIAIVAAIGTELYRQSILSIREFGWQFWQTDTWDPVSGEFGARPFIWGTLYSSILALLIATPIALGIAVFISELCPARLRQPLVFLTELLAAIPSMLPAQPQVRDRALDVIRQVLSTRGAIDGEMAERFKQIEGLFKTEQSRDAGADAIARAAAKDAESRKAS